MYKTLPVIFAAGAVAQSTITTSWLAFGFENTPVASVVGADSNAVTYFIECSNADIVEGNCGLAGGMTITQGASVFEVHYTENDVATDYTADFTMDASCAIQGTTAAVCVETDGGAQANFPGVTTETITGTDMSFGTLLITAGFDKLSATAGGSASGTHASATGPSSASETGSSAQSGSRTSAAASATGSAASSTATASMSGSASGSAASASSTGGAARFAVPVAGVAGVLAAALAL
ncbi:hypothetical protein B0J12DRAFT_644381 [Macrophomina phaseolina]|uniref:GPI anchored cell wall protein n=1 Tax=Macrophomina phaseolina TaxID=35725 RepID=A0ABQ8GQG2_9PEZI|nr:hypothetical protein B0J12DRAFT_644381 [Macrophomina phaseolina]